ncbi:MAG TPA: DUF3465 domain-containing protein [Methylotenera sp.]|nr:DUF3465 domain-containing protein [Methylotenera sp.]HPN01410.1 DUF3465 domain-containing protein [Methylotenera sp.]
MVLFTALVACKQTASDIVGYEEQVNNQTVTGVEQSENSALIQAFQGKKSNLFVEGSGVVKKLLPEDNKGSRHQKFLVTISDKQTLLFAHNIDLSKSIPLAVGDTIEFRGEYVYNPKGGVMHWTHHDPQAKIEGGWIKHNGQIYQ